MNRPREFDEAEALDAARDVFWEFGYAGATLTELTDRMGLNKGSLYGAFGDKHQLFRAVVERYQEQARKFVEVVLEQTGSARESLEAWFGRLASMCTAPDGERGCLVVNTVVELVPHDEEIATVVQDHQRVVERMLQDLIERGQEDGEFCATLDSREQARFLLTVMFGMQVRAKTKPTAREVRETVDLAISTLDT